VQTMRRKCWPHVPIAKGGLFRDSRIVRHKAGSNLNVEWCEMTLRLCISHQRTWYHEGRSVPAARREASAPTQTVLLERGRSREDSLNVKQCGIRFTFARTARIRCLEYLVKADAMNHPNHVQPGQPTGRTTRSKGEREIKECLGERAILGTWRTAPP
jgi:hypothetical protein